jgi:hypothetical protein
VVAGYRCVTDGLQARGRREGRTNGKIPYTISLLWQNHDALCSAPEPSLNYEPINVLIDPCVKRGFELLHVVAPPFYLVLELTCSEMNFLAMEFLSDTARNRSDGRKSHFLAKTSERSTE